MIHNNQLYPVFFRLDKLKILIVGAGAVGTEKLFFILKSSPNANIRIVACSVSREVEEIIKRYPTQIRLVNRKFRDADVKNVDIVIAATQCTIINYAVYNAAKDRGKIVNVADTPDLCDFYMGSIVTRGDLKIAISTNGKSPTFSKRLRQVLEQTIPEETCDLLDNLNLIRANLKIDFKNKILELNRITKLLIEPISKQHY